MSKDNNKPARTGTVPKDKQFIEEVFKKNPVGRPRMYESAEELEAEIQKFFVYCYESKQKLTITGIVLFLGFSDRKSFYEYEQNPEFTHTIKKARTLIEYSYELKLHEAFPQGAVFALKNLGWSAEENINNTVNTKKSFYIGGTEDEEDFTDYEETE